jgi:predicted RNA-binding Zn-ribbon protein involved in translation (DUF1610 family)
MTFHIVIACPHCKRALGVREDQKTATCPRCGRELVCRRARAYHRTEDMAELARLVGEMNARLEHGFKRYERDARTARGAKDHPMLPPGLESLAARVANTRGRRGQLDAAVGGLCAREGASFSSDELLAVLGAAGWPEDAVATALEGMVREGALVEPRPDRFIKA